MNGKKVIIKEVERGLEIQAGDMIQRLIPVAPQIIRCIASRKEIQETPESLIILPERYQEAGADYTVGEDGQQVTLSTGNVMVSADRISGNLTWKRADGSLWLQEKGKELSETDVITYTTNGEKPIVKRVKTVDGERNFIQNLKEVRDRKAYRAKLYFEFQEQEGIHGLGQAEEGIYDYRGHNQYLYQHNMRIPMPFMTSTLGYGILVDCCSLMTFSDENDGAYLLLDTVDQVDYYFIGGENLDDVIGGYRYLTGRAQMLPRWAFGYIQSKEQYYTAKELVDIVRKYRELQVPLDCVVQDWNTWENGKWGNKLVDKSRYGDLKACLDEIHEMNAHAMVSIWPNMSTDCENYTEMMDAGYMLGDLSTYDAFREEARALYWKQCNEELFSSGFDSWWCDSSEPFSGPDWNGEVRREPWERYMLVGSEHKKYLDAAKANAFSLMHARGIYENQRKERDDIRVFNLTRSGYAGSQRYSAMLWSGDICATWETLRRQITEGLNMGMSGYPFWTLDIGAFFTVNDKWQNRGCGCNTDPTPKWFWQGDYNEGVGDLGYRELYTRWLQVGAFLPMFRSHGTDTPREIWNFGKKGDMFYDAIEKFIKLRYRLMPYLYSLAADVHFHHGTIMRSLIFDFAQDEKARSISDEFMFGPSLLICPVTGPMYYGPDSMPLDTIDEAKTKECYLPAGTGWYDYWSGAYYSGGQSVLAEAGIDRIPVFVREGSILPVTEGLQYADQVQGAPLEVLVYTGADAEFTLYEDEGNSYEFEKGAFATTSLVWSEQEHRLQINDRTGAFPGMKEQIITVSYIEK